MRMPFSRLVALFSLVFAVAAPTSSPAATFWEKLEQPGVHAIMRHALAPGTGDPADFNLDDCDTQRNLDERGRAQARSIGRAFRAYGIAFDRVLTSQWCRCRETARLLDLGTAGDFPVLNSFFADRSTSREQTRDLRSFLRSLPAKERVFLVTHQVNITALTGRAVGSGQVFLISVQPDGNIAVLDSLRMGL